MSSLLPLLFKFIKFGVVGFICLAIDFSITYFCKEKLKFYKYVANSCGFCFGVMVNYYLNRHWTFENHNPHVYVQFIRFLCVATIGLGLNNLITYYFADRKEYNFYVSKGFATVLVFFWNFSMNMLFTFNVPH
jgi:putative flippase GtrA